MGCIFCVIGIGGGLLFLKKLGIEESIVALWVSAMNTAVAFYLAGLIKKKIFGLRFLLSAIFYFAVYFYLLKTNQMNNKVFTGLTVGMETYFVAHFIERIIHKKNKDRNLFPYQKVIITIVFVALASLVTIAALK